MDSYTKTKTWAALTAFILLVIGTELGQDSKWYLYTVSFLGVIAVYWFPNKPKE